MDNNNFITGCLTSFILLMMALIIGIIYWILFYVPEQLAKARENIKQVKDGMTIPQVTEIMGSPQGVTGNHRKNSPYNGKVIFYYSTDDTSCNLIIIFCPTRVCKVTGSDCAGKIR